MCVSLKHSFEMCENWSFDHFDFAFKKRSIECCKKKECEACSVRDVAEIESGFSPTFCIKNQIANSKSRRSMKNANFTLKKIATNVPS